MNAFPSDLNREISNTAHYAVAPFFKEIKSKDPPNIFHRLFHQQSDATKILEKGLSEDVWSHKRGT